MQRLIIILFIVFTTSIQAQRRTIDSLTYVLYKADDTTAVLNRIKLSELYRNYNNDTSEIYSREALKMAQQIKYLLGEGMAHNAIGYNLYVSAKYTEAIAEFEEFRKISEQRNDHLNTGSAINNIGNVYIELGNYSKALGYYEDALTERKRSGDKSSIAASYNNIGYLNKEIGDYDNAIENILQALRIYDEVNDESGKTYCYTFMGVIYGLKRDYVTALENHQKALGIQQKKNDRNGEAISLQSIASIYIQQLQFEKALDYFKQASDIYSAVGDKRQLASVTASTADIWLHKNDPEKALVEFNKALELNRSIGNTRGLASNYINIANCLLLQKNEAAAKPALDSAFFYASFTGKKEDLKNVYKTLADYYSTRGDYNKAFDNYKKYDAIKDSLFNIENSKAIAGMQTKYETEKKERLIQEQKFEITKKNYYIIGSLALLALGSLLTFSYYRRYKLKQEKKLHSAIMRQQDIATRSIIEAEENERKRIASDLHDGVGQMMSAAKMNLSSFESKAYFKSDEDKLAFEKIISLVDESCREVRNVSHNMMPNALLKRGLSSAVKEFVDKIDHHILKVNLYSEGLNDRLDSNLETVLYRVIQECVNNVIKHSSANQLDISLIRDEDGISATIEDNGIGFTPDLKQQVDGIGLKNITARVEYLKGHVDFDSAPGKGTLVAIHVPI